jgi:hypothetical protein
MAQLLAAGSFAAYVYAMPVVSGGEIRDSYRLHVGKAQADSWPSVSEWISDYDTM